MASTSVDAATRSYVKVVIAQIRALDPQTADSDTIIQLAEQLRAAALQLQKSQESREIDSRDHSQKLRIMTTYFDVKPNIGFREEVKVTGGVAPYSLYFRSMYPEGIHIRERMWLVGAVEKSKQIEICVRDARNNHAEGAITFEVKRSNELMVIPSALAVYHNGKYSVQHK